MTFLLKENTKEKGFRKIVIQFISKKGDINFQKMAFILMQSLTGVKRRSPTEKKFLDRTKNDLTDMNMKNVKIRRRECITTILFEKQKFTFGEKI